MKIYYTMNEKKEEMCNNDNDNTNNHSCGRLTRSKEIIIIIPQPC